MCVLLFSMPWSYVDVSNHQQRPATRSWAQEMVGKDPEYFSRWGSSQEPDFLYIGCADSRVPVRPATSKTCAAKALLSWMSAGSPEHMAAMPICASWRWLLVSSGMRLCVWPACACRQTWS